MDKDKLYRVAFFLTYHKQAREGWFWRVFGMAFDGRLRQTLQNIAVDYRKTSQNQPLAFDDYLEMLLRHEEEKTGMSAERNQSEQAVVKAFQKQYGLDRRAGTHAGMKTLSITITAADDDFLPAVEMGLEQVLKSVSAGETANEGGNEYGRYAFMVSGNVKGRER